MNDSLAPKKRFFIETYGCQMNKYDSELVAGILSESGYETADNPENADLILINTCSVRDHAEKRALGRIGVLAEWKKQSSGHQLAVIGCMSQRMGAELKSYHPHIDFILGPDTYRTLPSLLGNGHTKSVHTDLNSEENYSYLNPVRETTISGWIAIMRGCDNFCTYCIVPYTRGRERSRPAQEILTELESMLEQGYQDITLLGQNVNSYRDGKIDFANLLKMCSQITPKFCLRFMTSHPKDLNNGILETMASYDNICPHLHLPFQSGSDRILQLMNRKYTRADYLRQIEKARRFIPDIALTTDILVGFPGEMENDFQDTVSLLKDVQFDDAFTYRYSTREGARAADMEDFLTDEEKLKRLDKIIQIQRKISLQKKMDMVGKNFEVLPECESKKSDDEWLGKTPTNHMVVFPKENVNIGQYVHVHIDECRGSTLRGTLLAS